MIENHTGGLRPSHWLSRTFFILDRSIVKVLVVLVISLLLLMVTCATLQIVFRYVLEKPLAWSEELARFAFTWVSFLAAALALDKQMHFGLDILVKGIKPERQRVFRIFVNVLIIAFSFILIKNSTALLKMAHMTRSSGLKLRISYVYLAIPTGAFFYIYFAGKQAVSDLLQFIPRNRSTKT